METYDGDSTGGLALACAPDISPGSPVRRWITDGTTDQAVFNSEDFTE